VGYMAKRIQMRKNRFLAIQKMAEQKKNEALHASNANINDVTNLDLGPKQTVHDQRSHCKAGSRENTITKYNNSHQNNRFNNVNSTRSRFDDETGTLTCPPPPALPKVAPPPMSVVTPKDINRMFGITASDIDKYSRVIFPITFLCFQLMYWIIYQHLSDILVEDLVFLQKE